MNERIKQLAKQAGGGPSKWYTDPDVLEYFAELIVQECIELCEQVRAQSVSNGSDDYTHGREMGAEICRNTIFKYFGADSKDLVNKSPPEAPQPKAEDPTKIKQWRP